MIDAGQAKPRWYHLTPGRVVFGLLLVEGFLWLSERCHWFAFNEHRGWTMLIAAAAVGAALLAMLLWFAAAFVFRRRFQFSILSLLILMVVVAMACGWLAAERQRARKHREVLEKIASLGVVDYDYDLAPLDNETQREPPWLRRLLGDDPLAHVMVVDIRGSAVSDAEIEDLEGMARLVLLRLDGTAVGDAGLERLRGMTRLQYLDLSGTKVSDAGLQHLRGLTNLLDLNLSGTKVSDAGVRDLKKALPKAGIIGP